MNLLKKSKNTEASMGEYLKSEYGFKSTTEELKDIAKNNNRVSVKGVIIQKVKVK